MNRQPKNGKILSLTGIAQIQESFFSKVVGIEVVLAAFDRLPDSMFMIKDRDSRYIYMSQGLRAVIPLREGQEVIGKTDFDLFPKIVAQSYRQNDLLVLEQGRTLIDEVHAGGFVEGVPKWFLSSKFPLRDREGDIIGLFTTNQRYEEVMGGADDLNRLLPAIQYIGRHYATKITVAELARLCSFSESHFMRQFRDRMKMSAGEFIEQTRMFHAIDSIRHSARSIAQVALDCGFYDHSSFVKRFKKFTGVTPLKYRNDFKSKLRSDPAMALPQVSSV